MTVREVNEKPLAIGLSWLPPGEITAGRSENRKMRELRRIGDRPACYAEIVLPGTTQVAVTSNPEAAGHLSGAAWLSAAQKSVVLVEQIGDNEFWLAAVEDGVVFPAGDVVGGRDLISARLKELTTDLAGSGISYHDKSRMFELAESSPLDFSDLISGTEADAGWTVRPIRRSAIRTVVIPFAGALCLVSGFAAWHLRPAAPPATEATDPSGTASQNVQLEREKTQLSQTLSQDAGRLVDELIREIAARPGRSAGWRNVSAEWSDGRVTTEWQRAHGSYMALVDQLTGRQFWIDENTGAVTESFPLAPAADFDDNLAQRLATAPERYALLDALASLPGQWTLAPSQRSGNEYHVRKSRLTGSVTGFEAARAAAHFFGNHPVYLRLISVQLIPRPNWRFEGDFYEPAR